MDAIILQENIEGLLSLVRMLLPGGGSAGCVYLDDLSALQRSIHKQINDLYSQRGKTPEQDATLCLAILQGYNVSMYANPEDEERKQAVFAERKQSFRLSGFPHGMKENHPSI